LGKRKIDSFSIFFVLIFLEFSCRIRSCRNCRCWSEPDPSDKKHGLPDSALICDKCFLREVFGEAGVTREALSPAIVRADSMRQTASMQGLDVWRDVDR
jgi:hypothetical protein